ncbi:MAG: hypothetical protein ABS949_08115 [Solibacillus sp.]
MFSTEQYLTAITSCLDKKTNQVIQTLQDVFTHPFAPDVELLDFSTFIDPIRFEFTVMMFSMDKNAGEVFTEETELFAGSLEIVQDASYYELDQPLHDAFFDFYEENGEELEQAEQEVFAAWFAACWEQAGGTAFSLPTYFGFHDAGMSYDLQHARFIDDSEKWA